MTRALTFYRTSIGKKVVMAITGLILLGFVIGHMLGNLQVFIGANQMNAYAAMLKANAALLWGTHRAPGGGDPAHRGCRPADAYEPAQPAGGVPLQRCHPGRLRRTHHALERADHRVFVIYHLLHLPPAASIRNLMSTMCIATSSAVFASGRSVYFTSSPWLLWHFTCGTGSGVYSRRWA